MDTCDNCSVFYQHSKHAALAFNCFVPSKPAKRTMVYLGKCSLFLSTPTQYTLILTATRRSHLQQG